MYESSENNIVKSWLQSKNKILNKTRQLIVFHKDNLSSNIPSEFEIMANIIYKIIYINYTQDLKDIILNI